MMLPDSMKSGRKIHFSESGNTDSGCKKNQKNQERVMKTNLLDLRIWEVLSFWCGGSCVLWVRRMLGSPDLGVCFDKKKWGGWVWGFGGTNLRGVDRVRMGIFLYGIGCKEIIMGCI